MSNDFRDRMLAATKVLRGRELELKKQIGAIYASCARDMEKEILKYGADSLAGRRAVTLQKSMRGYVKRLWREVHATAERAARDGAEIGIGIQTSLLDDALHGFGISTRASFAGAFGHTQDEAVTAVLNGSVYKGKRAALSRRIWNNEALQGGQIERLIAEATAQGRSAVELAKDLTAYINPDARMPDHWNEIYPMPFVYKTDYNAKRLAVTTLNHGYYQGMIMAARENPFAEYLHWELSSFHTIYDVCDLYMEHDEGLGLGNFALDSPDLPLPHPFCRCNYYIDSDKSLKEIGQEIGGWMNGEENLRLERAFGEWKKEYTLSMEHGIMMLGKLVAFRKDHGPVFDITGKASDSHPDEVKRILDEAKALGVEVVSRHGMAYAPGLRPGLPGQLHISPEDSIGAWWHEEQHMLDDANAGWKGYSNSFEYDWRKGMEERAYQREIDFAESKGRMDVVKELRKFLDEELKSIRGGGK